MLWEVMILGGMMEEMKEVEDGDGGSERDGWQRWKK